MIPIIGFTGYGPKVTVVNAAMALANHKWRTQMSPAVAMVEFGATLANKLSSSK